MNKLLLLSFLGAVFLLNACQSSEEKVDNSSKLFISYYSRYLQADRAYRAEADFLEGNSIQSAKPTEVSNVFFQGGSMKLRTIPGKVLSYKTDRGGPFQAKQQFKFRNGDEEVHYFDIQANPIESFLVKDGVRKNGGLSIVWEGNPLSADEEILVMVSDQKNKAATSTVAGPTDSPQLSLQGDFLKDLENGSGTIYLVRKQKGKKEEKNNFITYLIEFYTSSIKVNIEA